VNWQRIHWGGRGGERSPLDPKEVTFWGAGEEEKKKKKACLGPLLNQWGEKWGGAGDPNLNSGHGEKEKGGEIKIKQLF